MSERLAVPCMAIHWPTTDQGTPAPLHLVGEPAETLVRLVHFLVAAESSGSNGSLPSQFHDAVEAMVRQAALPWRGSATRTRLELPVDITRVAWIWSVLPSTYFSSGKVDKVLAAAALRQRDVRPLVGVADHFWKAKGSAVVQYIGYQWRPDPASGLIALSAGLAVASGLPLIVVWPRVFSKPGPEQVKLRESLARFKATGRGPLTDLALELGFLPEDIARFRARVSTDPDQFGTFGPDSKVGRILKDTAKLVVFGDAVVAP
ncbi:MAG: hypothetical protein M0Z95_03370 [Actinomycetota bacterium]|nr:hypothetical protein [Actinomycetota bacterium]